MAPMAKIALEKSLARVAFQKLNVTKIYGQSQTGKHFQFCTIKGLSNMYAFHTDSCFITRILTKLELRNNFRGSKAINTLTLFGRTTA